MVHVVGSRKPAPLLLYVKAYVAESSSKNLCVGFNNKQCFDYVHRNSEFIVIDKELRRFTSRSCIKSNIM